MFACAYYTHVTATRLLVKRNACVIDCCTKNVIPSLRYLQHLVWRGLNARDHVSWCKGNLLHLGEVVPWVEIEDHLANGDEWELLLGPHLDVQKEGDEGTIR